MMLEIAENTQSVLTDPTSSSPNHVQPLVAAESHSNNHNANIHSFEATLKDLKRLCRQQHEHLRVAAMDIEKWQTALQAKADRPKSGRVGIGYSALHNMCLPQSKTFEIKSSKDWNTIFQEVLEKPCMSFSEEVSKHKALEKITKEFLDNMQDKVRDIIHSLADPARSPVQTPPEECKVGSVAAFVLENPLDIKKATHELLANHVMMKALEGVCVPLMTVVQYLGYVIVLTAVTPTNSSTAVWGYCRHRVHSKSPHLQNALRRASEYLNLSPYAVADNVKDLMYGGAAIEGHVGKDGRYYVGHFEGLYPHYPPPRGQPIPKENTVLLRPEFLLQHLEPLSPGAFIFHGTHESRKQNMAVRAASAMLCQVTVPAVALSLTSNPPTSCADVVDRMHKSGVNVALMALVLNNVPAASKEVRSIILTEMVARAARNLLWQTLRVDVCGDEDEARSVISQYVCSLCDQPSRATMWKAALDNRLRQKYIAYSLVSPAPTSDDVVVPLLFQRFGELCGFKYAYGVTHEGSSPFHFSIDRIEVKCKSKPRWDFHICPEAMEHYWKADVDGAEALYKASLAKLHESTSVVNPYRGLQLMKELIRSLWYGPDGKLRFQAITKTESYCKKLVSQREKLDSGDSYVYTDDLIFLAAFYMSVKSFAPAVSVLEKVVSIRRRVLGPSVETGQALLVLSQAQINNRQHSEGLKALETALDMFSESCGTHHPKVMQTLCLIAALYEDRGQYSDAEPYYEQVLELYKTHYGPNHIKVSSALNNLAVNCYQQEKYEQAEELFKEDLRITEHTLGPDHISNASTLNNLACLYDLQEKYDLSEPLYKRDIEISTKNYGENHPSVATSYNNLAASYQKRRMLAEAELTYRKSLQIRQECFKGIDSIEIADSLNNLGTLLRQQGNLQQAKAYLEQSLAIYKKTLGSEHHLLRKCLENLQNLCEEMEEPEEAEQYGDHLLELVRGDQLASSPIRMKTPVASGLMTN